LGRECGLVGEGMTRRLRVWVGREALAESGKKAGNRFGEDLGKG